MTSSSKRIPAIYLVPAPTSKSRTGQKTMQAFKYEVARLAGLPAATTKAAKRDAVCSAIVLEQNLNLRTRTGWKDLLMELIRRDRDAKELANLAQG